MRLWKGWKNAQISQDIQHEVDEKTWLSGTSIFVAKGKSKGRPDTDIFVIPTPEHLQYLKHAKFAFHMKYFIYGRIMETNLYAHLICKETSISFSLIHILLSYPARKQHLKHTCKNNTEKCHTYNIGHSCMSLMRSSWESCWDPRLKSGNRATITPHHVFFQ